MHICKSTITGWGGWGGIERTPGCYCPQGVERKETVGEGRRKDHIAKCVAYKTL